MYDRSFHIFLILYTAKLGQIFPKFCIFAGINNPKTNMSLFSDNIRHLRMKKELSQSKVAESLAISRDRLAKYEEGKSQPPLEILVRLSRYYHVSTDLLLTVDIRKVDMDGLIRLEDNHILLPVAVDARGEHAIEIIPHRAKASYLAGYSDPEYIESLQHVSLPFLGSGKFRLFAIDGDSMPPHRDSSYIVGKYMERLEEMKAGRSYIVITADGMAYKRLGRREAAVLVLESDNAFYAPFEVRASDVLQVWEYAGSIATEEIDISELAPESIREMLAEIRRDVADLRAGK